MSKILNEISGSVPDWSQGPYTFVGQMNNERPITLLDLLQSTDTQYPNNIKVSQRLPAPGDSILDQLVVVWENIQELKNTIALTLRNPKVKEHRQLYARAVYLYNLFKEIEEKIKEVDKLANDYKITDSEDHPETPDQFVSS